MNRANLAVAAHADTSVLAKTDGWSAPLAGTHREAGPRMLQLAPADTLRVRPWKLAFGVLPHDGPPEQLQHPETARRRGNAGLREHLQPPGIAGSGAIRSSTQQPLLRIDHPTEPSAHASIPVPSFAYRIVRRMSRVAQRRASVGGPFEDRLEAGQPRASPHGGVHGVSEGGRSDGRTQARIHTESNNAAAT